MRELHRGNLPDGSSENFAKRSARFIAKKAARLVLERGTRILPASVLIFAGCSGNGASEKNSSSQELENRESAGYELPFTRGETWYLTQGPHGDGYSNGIKYGIDIAPPEGGFCPGDGRKFTINNRVVTASASGEVIAKGDDKNKNDPHHSEIRIKDKNGLTQVYIHLDSTKVKLGDKVKQGQTLGNPSCEYPPGGRNTGPHLHIGLMKDGHAIPIDGVEVGGWTIHNGVDGKDGTMTKPGEKTRTADVGRYGENSTGIRNDLPNNSGRAIVAGPKDPIPPISGSVKEKSSITPTSKPTGTPKAIPTPRQETSATKLVENYREGWLHLASQYGVEFDYPPTWVQTPFAPCIIPYKGKAPDISDMYDASASICVSVHFQVPQQMSLEVAVNNQVSANESHNLKTVAVKPAVKLGKYQAIEVLSKSTSNFLFQRQFLFINDLGGARFLQGLTLQSETESNLQVAENDFQQIASTIKPLFK